MSQKSSRSSSCEPNSPNEINDWTNLIDGVHMEPAELEIYEEHIRAMKEFQVQKPVDPKSLPKGKRLIEDEECSNDEEEYRKIHDENTDDEKEEIAKQRNQAKLDFEEDEEYHASQFRKLRDWETRKRLALENLEQPVELTSDVIELLMFGTPIQFVNKVTDPEMPDAEITGVLALYLTPECIARDQLFVDNETPLSLSLDVNPMSRNVFEIVSDDEGMKGFPITYKSLVYIKLHFNEENRDFFLSIDISSPYTVGKLYLQDSIDDLCQFRLLSVNNDNNKNQELIDLNSPVLIKHVKTGFYVMSKVNITVVNICGEEKFVVGSDEIEGNNVLWKLIYGAFNDDFDFDFNNFVTDPWWQPKVQSSTYIQPNTTIKDPFFCSKPSTSRDLYEAGPSNAPFMQQQSRHSDPEPCNAQWVEVGPGLQKCLGPPGSANEYMEDPENLFSDIKDKSSLGRTKKESQQIVVDYLESVRNYNVSPPRNKETLDEPSTWPKLNAKNRRLNARTIENNELIRENKYAKESFMWPKVPEIGTPNSKPILDSPEKIINAIKKINLQNAEMSPEHEELLVWPTIPDETTSATTRELIKKLEEEMMKSDEVEKYTSKKLFKDHENEGGNLKPNLGVKHVGVNELRSIVEKMSFTRSKLDSVPEEETDTDILPLPENFWNFFDSDNTQYMYSKPNSDTVSNTSTINSDIDMELEDTEVVNARIEEGQGDVCSQIEDSEKDKN